MKIGRKNYVKNELMNVCNLSLNGILARYWTTCFSPSFAAASSDRCIPIAEVKIFPRGNMSDIEEGRPSWFCSSNHACQPYALLTSVTNLSIRCSGLSVDCIWCRKFRHIGVLDRPAKEAFWSSSKTQMVHFSS